MSQSFDDYSGGPDDWGIIPPGTESVRVITPPALTGWEKSRMAQVFTEWNEQENEKLANAVDSVDLTRYQNDDYLHVFIFPKPALIPQTDEPSRIPRELHNGR